MDALNNNHIDVLRVFFKSGDPTLKDIIAYSGLSIEDATLATRELVRGGMVRMKDNDLEHDWRYALTNCGREQRNTHCAANPPIKAFVAADVTPDDIVTVVKAVACEPWATHGELASWGNSCCRVVLRPTGKSENDAAKMLRHLMGNSADVQRFIDAVPGPEAPRLDLPSPSHLTVAHGRGEGEVGVDCHPNVVWRGFRPYAGPDPRSMHIGWWDSLLGSFDAWAFNHNYLPDSGRWSHHPDESTVLDCAAAHTPMTWRSA